LIIKVSFLLFRLLVFVLLLLLILFLRTRTQPQTQTHKVQRIDALQQHTHTSAHSKSTHSAAGYITPPTEGNDGSGCGAGKARGEMCCPGPCMGVRASAVERPFSCPSSSSCLFSWSPSSSTPFCSSSSCAPLLHYRCCCGCCYCCCCCCCYCCCFDFCCWMGCGRASRASASLLAREHTHTSA
jgi:hypothetical protein